MVVALPGVSTLHWSSVAGPQGACVVMSTEAGICWLGTPGTPLEAGLSWVQRRLTFEHAIQNVSVEPLRLAIDELGRYFAGERLQFTCPLDLRGTPFQLMVWNALTRIPYGETRSYTEIAREIGHANAVRAVGAANGANPVAIIVPCHRVIGSNGSLTGYGGGLPTKAWLLALEHRVGEEPRGQ
jgi:methylated-DNA-[protein]-cysteine S-methyltransferase